MFTIAEIGVNHEGSIKKAKLMIAQAAKAGFSAAKFQTYKAEKIASKNSPAYWDTKKEKTKNQIELFSKFDSFDLLDYKILAKYCKKNKIEFMSTAFDLQSLKFINPLVKRHKIASADITNFQLIKKIAEYKKPVILSTGASTIKEIENAINIISKYIAHTYITICHCVLLYPTPLNKSFLERIKIIKKKFPKCNVGYSDHVLNKDNYSHLLFAQGMGVKLVEKHFTFDRNLPGNDHYHAFDYKISKKWLDDSKKLNLDSDTFKEKKFLKAQKLAIKNARRKIYSSKALLKNSIIKEEDIICLRGVKGICASKYDEIIGKKLKKNILKGEAFFQHFFFK